MEEKRKMRSNVKQSKSERRYFNPYEKSKENSLQSSTSRHTYREMKRTKAKKKSNPKSNLESTIQKQNRTPKKKKRVIDSKLDINTKKRQQSTGVPRSGVKKHTPNIKSIPTEEGRNLVNKKKKLTKMQRMYLKRRRQIQITFRIALVMTVIVGTIWGSTLVVESLTKTRVSSQIVKMGSLDTSTVFEGIVFRNEKIVLSEDEGYAQYIAAEGEKVEKDGTVYVLVDEENLATTTAAKEEVDSKIYNEAENKEALSTNQDKRYNLDQEIKTNMKDFYNNRYESSTSYIYNLRSKLDRSVNNRTELYASEQEATNQELIQLKQDIEANLAKYQKGKAVTQPGVISYYMDGNETEDASQIIETLTYNKYNQYRKGNNLITLGPTTLKKDEPIYKLIFNNEWYVVTYINTKDDQWTLGHHYDLTFNAINDQSIQFTLISKKEEESRTKLVFKSSNQIGKFLSIRGTNFSIGDKDMVGLKIPLQAIVELNLIKIPAEYVVVENDVQGVYRKKGEQTSFVPLEVHEKKNETYYIIQDLSDLDTIQLNDIIVLKNQNQSYTVTETEVASGVYVINNQVAKFRQVEFLTQNEEYALVKYNANSQLKEMDKIISNPKSISKDQLLEDMKIQNE